MAGLSRSSLRLLVIGLVAIVVVSVGAATIGASVDFGGTSGSLDDDESGPTDPRDRGNASGNVSFDDGGEGQYYNIDIQRCIEPLASIPGTLAYFGLFGAFLYGIRRRYSLGSAMMTAFGVSPFVVTGYFLGTDCSTVGGGGAPISAPSPSTNVLSLPDVPPVVLIGVLGLLLVGAAAVVVRATGDQYEELEQDEEGADEPDVSDLAAAAGAAADRLEKHNADVDNAVYRAWWEMTNLLDVPNPDSATPGEFAEAAVDVGLSEPHVTELTTLFEEVRYGQRDPATREEHAIEVFREIESTYGGDVEVSLDPDAADDGGSR